MENTFSVSVREELYKTYPNDTQAMQDLEAAYEMAAKKALKENAG